MSLEEYRRKRNFSATPEPAPESASSKERAGAPRFFVQRHHATNLHYDFRLEIHGTLKSWAIPKGPTLDPAVKHFAAMVEDHPLDYGNFEGNIPKGNYGGGSVMLWDRGTFDLLGEVSALDQIARGDLKFHLHGEKLNGDFALVQMKNRGKGNEWLILKKKDTSAVTNWDIDSFAYSVATGRTQEEIAKDLPAEPKTTQAAPFKAPAGAMKAPMPEFFTPMGASLATSMPTSERWIAELKWDGIRALCFLDAGDLRIYTRTGHRCERQYPELSVLPHCVSAKQAILDGEIAVLNAQGAPEFALIQPRIMAADAAAIANMTRTRPVTLFLFDVLYLDGFDLRGLPLAERRKLLEQVVTKREPVRVSEAFPASEDLLTAARNNGLEGLVAKCLTAPYESRRSRDWLKIKLVKQQEFVICGYTPGERDFFGALVLGYMERGKLLWAGNVGTGFDSKMLAAVYRLLEPLKREKSPLADDPKLPHGTQWVEPKLVCEVKFSNWTQDQHLRAPVFLGLRPDTDPVDCVMEEQVEANSEQDPEPEPKPEIRPAATKKSRPKKKTVSREPFFTSDAVQESRLVDGHELKFTNLNKIYFPKDGFTKRDLLNYYAAVAPLLLPHLAGRPLSLKRYPNGIEADYFFQKDAPESYPKWLQYEQIEDIRYVLAADTAALLYLTNLGCIDQNPWMSRVGTLHNPDFILIDLDPQQCSFDKIVQAALLVREILDSIGLAGYPKTTGGDGMHVYIPVEPVYSYDDVKQFAELISGIAVSRKPELFTTPRTVSKRQKDRVYFDALQNGEGKTIAAPYVVRAYERAPVATPLEWDEVRPGLDPKQFTICNAIERFDQRGELFADVLKKPQTLDKAFGKLEKLVRR